MKYRALKSKVGTNDIDGEILAKAIEEDKAKLERTSLCISFSNLSACVCVWFLGDLFRFLCVRRMERQAHAPLMTPTR